VRSQISDGKIARVIFCIYEENMVLLHGFVKKSQKTPTQDLQLAKRRQRTLVQ
jgi:phage-related protein